MAQTLKQTLRPDLWIELHGRVVLVRALTGRGRTFVERNTNVKAWQWTNGCCAIAPTESGPLFAKAARAGLGVRHTVMARRRQRSA